MKKIYSILSVAILFATVLAGCQGEKPYKADLRSTPLKGYTFVVNANLPQTKAVKQGWAAGDEIYFALDGNMDNFTSWNSMKYDGTGWNVTMNKFYTEDKIKTSGSIVALYASGGAAATEDNMEVSGNILYTEAGKYTVDPSVKIVYIDLNLNTAVDGLTQVTIEGLDAAVDEYEIYIPGYKQVSKIAYADYAAAVEAGEGIASCIKADSDNLFAGFDKANATAVVFPYAPLSVAGEDGEGESEVDPADPQTTVYVMPKDGALYSRTYDKAFKEKTAVLLSGPFGNDKDEWTKLCFTDTTDIEVAIPETIKMSKSDAVYFILSDGETKAPAGYTLSAEASDKYFVNASVVTNDGLKCIKLVATDAGDVIPVTITAKNADITYSRVINLDISHVFVEDLLLAETEVGVDVDGSYRLAYTPTPEDASVAVTWVSEDESIAKVDDKGVVTGVAPGTVKVYALAKASDGTDVKSDECVVTVSTISFHSGYERVVLYVSKPDNNNDGKVTVNWDDNAHSQSFNIADFSDKVMKLELKPGDELEHSYEVVVTDKSGNEISKDVLTGAAYGPVWEAGLVERTARYSWTLAGGTAGNIAITATYYAQMTAAPADCKSTIRYTNNRGEVVEYEFPVTATKVDQQTLRFAEGSTIEYRNEYCPANGLDTISIPDKGEWKLSPWKAPHFYFSKAERSEWRAYASHFSSQGSYGQPSCVLNGNNYFGGSWVSLMSPYTYKGTDGKSYYRMYTYGGSNYYACKARVLMLDLGKPMDVYGIAMRQTNQGNMAYYRVFVGGDNFECPYATYDEETDNYTFTVDANWDEWNAKWIGNDTAFGTIAAQGTGYSSTRVSNPTFSEPKRGRYIAVVFLTTTNNKGQLHVSDFNALALPVTE